MPTVVCLAGPQTQEHLRLLTDLAELLGSRGLKVGVVCPSSQDPPPPPPPAQAAAGPVLELGPQGYCLRQTGPPPTWDQLLARHFNETDLVLSSLHHDKKVIKIEFCPPGLAPTLLEDPNLRGLVAEEPPGPGLLCFSPQDLGGLAAFVQGLLPPAKATQARVLADGRRLVANQFVQEIVAGTVRGLISSLKGGEKAGRLEIHLY